jgi:glycosyltransferase involved in cell wall biosynthesis
MRILFAPIFYLPMKSGLPLIVHQLAQNLFGKGHEIVVVTSKFDPALPSFERIDGIEIHRLPFVFPKRIFWQFPQENLLAFSRHAPGDLAKLLRLMADRHFDLIHLHSINGPHFLYVLLAQWLVRYPLVVTLHGSEFFLLNSRRMDWRRQLARITFRRAAAITSVSAKTASEAAKLCPEVAEKIITIPNFVSVNEFAGPEPTPFSFPYVLSAGRLNPIKGHDVLLSAFKRVAEQDGDIRLVVAGDGSEKIRLHALSLALGLKERVTFLGEVDRERVKRLMAGCEFLVIGSWSEGIPLVALEGMASGKPVVSTQVGGMPEVVRHTDTGLLVPPGDPPALAEAMLSLLHRPDRLRGMGERARQYVKANHDSAQTTERYLEVYRALLQPREKT